MNTVSAATPIGGSFIVANQAPPRRLIVAVDGLEKQGKTNFALTAPGPLAYQNWDIGDEGVVEKFQTHKQIYRADYSITVDKTDTQATIMEKMVPEWERCVKDYKLALGGLKSGAIRTIIKDTSTEEWEAIRLARLGKLQQVMPHHYVALNSEYRNLIREVFNTPGNMVLLHKLKSEWKEGPGGKSNKTGGYERAGYSDTGFLVQVNATAYRDKEGVFHILVRDCRQNAGCAGLDLAGDMATFAWLGVHVYPETSLEDWE